MDLIHFFDHHGKKIDKAHFVHLIQVSKADGKVDASELDFLYRIGKKFGFTDAEIEKLILSGDASLYTAPYELEKKFEQMFDIVAMLLIDDNVDERELKIAKQFAIAAGFEDDKIEMLLNLLIDGLKNDKNVEELFTLYKSK